MIPSSNSFSFDALGPNKVSFSIFFFFCSIFLNPKKRTSREWSVRVLASYDHHRSGNLNAFQLERTTKVHFFVHVFVIVRRGRSKRSKTKFRLIESTKMFLRRPLYILIDVYILYARTRYFDLSIKYHFLLSLKRTSFGGERVQKYYAKYSRRGLDVITFCTEQND
ncbi:hypothetical protein V1477_005824 [Vespula maculifrons]|uniref:Uncharacterized protein n=1 Tax=Vespula maculifrons TaxID=7453 RepID=A0ABD2CLN0_VESMC